MKRVLTLICDDGEIYATINIVVCADGSRYKSGEVSEKVHELFDNAYKMAHEHFYFDQIKVV